MKLIERLFAAIRQFSASILTYLLLAINAIYNVLGWFYHQITVIMGWFRYRMVDILIAFVFAIAAHVIVGRASTTMEIVAQQKVEVSSDEEERLSEHAYVLNSIGKDKMNQELVRITKAI